MRSQKPYRSGGLSLIELIITSALLGFILVILFSIYPNSILTIRHAENRLKAAMIAQSLLEQKKAAPFSQIEAKPDTSVLSSEELAAYTPEFECYNIPTADSSKLRKIRIVVTWKERDNACSVYKECYVCSARP